MIPSLVSSEIQEALQDFLDTEFRPSNPELTGIFDDFLSVDDSNFIKGPYVSLALPFQQSPSGPEPFPEIPLGFTPYQHQAEAFDRLSRGRSTIVATGTGSGKTESFLYPILDWCRQQSDQPGIKAILIYPMNALANDQAGRIASIIHRTESLKNKVIAGLYVGQDKQSKEVRMTSTRIISNRETLVESPPDILLTNYKMLDYLLSRPRDQRLWRQNAPGTLRWLVVDELHTFDGAQGTDLACLIRRLKSRLEVDDSSLVCVGTSATLGSGTGGGLTSEAEPDNKELLDYAKEVFGEAFDEQAIVRERRLSRDEFRGGSLLRHHLLGRSGWDQASDTASFRSTEDYLRAQYQFFFGEDPGPVCATDSWRLALADELRGHSMFDNLLRILHRRPRSLDEICAEIRETYSAFTDQELRDVVRGLCALVSAARVRGSESPDAPLRPFLQVSFHVWVRELGRMVCSLAEPAQSLRANDQDDPSSGTNAAPAQGDRQPYSHSLRYSDDLTTEDGAWVHLPLVQCRVCRVTGWAANLNSASNRLDLDLRKIYNAYFGSDVGLRFLFPESGPSHASGGKDCSVCGACGSFRLGHHSGACSECSSQVVIQLHTPDSVAVRTEGEGRDQRQVTHLSKDCPYCLSADSIFIFGARSTALLSIVIAQIYASRHNQDRKVIAFSDNVQDAAHRAGFISHRTWQTTKRAAIAQAVDGESPHSLEDVPARLKSKWSDTDASPSASSPELFVERFLAPDRTWLNAFKEFQQGGELPPRSLLPELVSRRLEWDALAEFGWASSAPRSLERSGAAAAGPDQDRVLAACEDAVQQIREEIDGLDGMDVKLVVWIALGLLRRLKRRGAVWAPDVDAVKRYLESGCSRWELNRNLALPGLGPSQPVPTYPAESAARRSTDGLEPLVRPGGGAWYQRWVVRVLAESFPVIGPAYSTTILRIVLDHLQSRGLVRSGQAGSQHVWAIEPRNFHVSTDLREVRASTSTRSLIVPSPEAEHWVGAPCIDLGVKESYSSVRVCEPGWAGRLYRDSEIHRVVAEDHTSLLGREKRERLEQRFSDPDSRPFDPNVLSATPTLELGIDIGNLSTVAMCSVPPSSSSYLQRIGRAGRRDGNAVTITMAAASPRDIAYFGEPLELLDGPIEPPGVFLNASAVLERQLTSFCLDNWARTCIDKPDAVPRTVQKVLDAVEQCDESKFPYTFFEYTRQNAPALFERFTAALQDSLSDDSREYLQEFLAGKPDGLPEFRLRVLRRLEQVVRERRSLSANIERRRKQIKDDEREPEDERILALIEQQKRERKGLMRLLRSINQRETFGFLTDEGLIPNYAFPEEGVTLRSVILRMSNPQQAQQAPPDGADGRDYIETYEYVRPSAAALSELAPGNRFYAEGHKVEIDRVDLDTTESGIEEWRLCPSCTYCRRTDLGDSEKACPRCGDPMWSDAGQKRPMLPLRLVHATTTAKSAQIGDDRDDRESSYYRRELVADFGTDTDRLAYAVCPPGLPFGFEYSARTVFREMNFGRSSHRGKPTRFAGHELPREGFRVCRHCGQVQSRRGDAPPEHAYGCPKGDHRVYAALPGSDAIHASPADAPGKSPIVDCLYLYRKFESESLRILVPAIEATDNDPKLQSFIAAVELGLRAKFRGKVDHLKAMVSPGVAEAGALQRNYVVLYDTVPGGTGYLKQLAQPTEAGLPNTVLEVLEVAKDRLTACSCDDGCYRCLYPYRKPAQSIPPSKRLAIELLDQILQDRNLLERLDRIDDLSIDGLIESNLEARFIAALDARAKVSSTIEFRNEIINGKSGHFMTVGSQSWRIEPQADLGPGNGVPVRSRPDFLLRPEEETPSKRPVAVFLDGFRYHRDSTGDDSIKRLAVIRGGLLQWSLTWRDLEPEFGGSGDALDLLRPESGAAGETKNVQQKLDSMWAVGPLRSQLQKSSFDLLLQYLEDPDSCRWKQAVFAELLQVFDRATMADPQFRGRFDSFLAESLPPEAVSQQAGANGQVFVGATGGSLGSGSPHVDLVASLPASAIQDPDPDQAFVAVHLHDDHSESADEKEYRVAWNAALRAFNLIQFLPGAWWTTRTAVRSGLYPDFSVTTPPAVPGSAATNAAWSEVRELACEEVMDLVAELARSDLAVPNVGYPLQGGRGEVVAEAELAWEAQRVAVLVPSEEEAAKRFEEAGWIVCEAGIRASELAVHLDSRPVGE